MKKVVNLSSFIILLALALSLAPPAALAQDEVVCDSDVVVQANDWLSKLADKFYGDVLAYQAIADATNAKNASDSSYAKIENVDLIEPGWKLCIPPAAVATTAAAGAEPTAEMKIQNAMSAGPQSIAPDAAIMDWPTEAGGKLTELRQGTNAWTCLPDDPTTPTNDPVCVDKMWKVWFEAAIAGTEPQITTPGIAYMLQGGSVADNDDPSILEPPAGQDWQVDPPHLMVVFPEKLDPAVFSSDPQSGGPWIMFGGTPYEHLMVPAKLEEIQPAEDKIQNAMSAGPQSIAPNAAIMDWPTEAGGKLTELRQGTNAWTCLPDDPTTPTNDPVCVDKMWKVWFEAAIAGTEPQITTPGIAYMLQGGSVADNDDPSILEPPAGQDWQVDPPHLMVVFPEKLDPAVFSSDPQSGGPWIMFGGTPYEHLMVPVTERSD